MSVRAFIVLFLFLAGSGCLKLKGSFDDNFALFVSALPTLPKYVAVGAGARVYLSDDGFTWRTSTVSTDTTIQLNAVLNTTNRIIAVGQQGTTCVIYSTTDGVNWAAASLPSGCNSGLRDLASGNSMIVAVGGTNPAVAMYSRDGGATWTNAPTGLSTSSFYRITHTGTTFMAAALSANFLSAYTSATPGTNPFTATAAQPLSAKEGLITAIVGDLITASGTTIIAAECDDIGCGPAPNNAPSASSTTNNGTTWNYNSPNAIFTATATIVGNGMAYSGSRLVAVGTNCRVDISSTLNPTNWSASALTMNGCSGVTWNGLEWDGSKFIAVGTGGKIAYSATGNSSDWTTITPGTASILGISYLSR